jgi:acyl-CoA thioesterase II
VPASRLRPSDAHLLGLEAHPGDPTALSFLVLPRLCRTDGRFYGGAALAVALAASEAVTGRPALWSSTQLVASADLGSRVRVDVDVVAEGRSVSQVQVRGTVDGKLVFASVGSTAAARDGGLEGTGQVMPRVAPPDDAEPWRGPRGPRDEPAAIGHHLVSEHREAEVLDRSDARPGQMAIWARLTGEVAGGGAMSPATLGFLADMVPLACARSCGVAGAGTSLDNSLRIGEPADTEWVLLDLDAHVAVGGHGHGRVHVWSPDGRMLATGTQSALLFSIEDFNARQSAR